MSLHLREFLETKYVDQPFYIGRGILPVRSKALIAGEPKANKSFIVLNLMLDLAHGRNGFGGAKMRDGHPLLPIAKPFRVLYLEQELGEQGLLERFRGKKGGTAGLLADYSREQLDALDIHIKPRDTKMRLDTQEGEDYIGRELQACKPDVLFIDPFAKFHLRDENSSQEMSMVLKAMDAIIEQHGCSIVLVHHTNKNNPEHPKTGGARIRGSSAIFGDIDTLITVDRKSPEKTVEPVIELSFTMRRGEPIDEMFVQRLRNGAVVWMGEGFQYSEESLGSGQKWPQGVSRR